MAEENQEIHKSSYTIYATRIRAPLPSIRFRVTHDNFEEIKSGDILTLQDEEGKLYVEIAEKVTPTSIITIGRKQDELPFETENIYRKTYSILEVNSV